MKERKQFVREDLRGEHSVSELGRRFGISRKAGRNRAGPPATTSLGPKKPRAVLARSDPGVELPAQSTFAKILSRNGLVRPRRHRTPPVATR
jgi:hypothetical protein